MGKPPWSSNRVKNRDNRRDVNRSPYRNFNFGNKYGQRKNNTVEEKCDHMSCDLSHNKETVDHIQFLPEIDILQCQTT